MSESDLWSLCLYHPWGLANPPCPQGGSRCRSGTRDDTNTETTSEVHLAEDDTNIEPTSTESKTEVHLAEKPKRKLTKPAYLRDYV